MKTDRELIALCAEAMGLEFHYPPHEAVISDAPVDTGPRPYIGPFWFWDPALIGWRIYDPLHSDLQAMALVKKFKLAISAPPDEGPELWAVRKPREHGPCSFAAELNRAIVEYVAIEMPRRPAVG